MMIPHFDEMKIFTIGYEKELHRRGWDMNPELFYIVAGHKMDPALLNAAGFGDIGGAGIRFYIGVAFPGQPEDAFGLAQMGVQVRHGNPPRILINGVENAFAGMMFAAEGYQVRKGTEALEEAQRSPTRDLGDIPGAEEVRFVHVLDSAGRYHMASRVRGRQPTYENSSANDRPDGYIAAGLRDLVYAIGTQSAVGQVDLKAVATIAPKANWGEEHVRHFFLG